MRTFSLFIEDTRYSVPTLVLATVKDESRIRELARARLEESPFHVAVEVREGDLYLFSLPQRDHQPSREHLDQPAE